LQRLVMRRRQALKLLQSLHRRRNLERLVIDPRRVQAAVFLERKRRNRDQEFLDLLLHRHEQPHLIYVPAHINLRIKHGPFVWVGAEMHDRRPTRNGANAIDDVTCKDGKMHFPVVPADGAAVMLLNLLARRNGFAASLARLPL
jgi:hypothetical protein